MPRFARKETLQTNKTWDYELQSSDGKTTARLSFVPNFVVEEEALLAELRLLPQYEYYSVLFKKLVRSPRTMCWVSDLPEATYAFNRNVVGAVNAATGAFHPTGLPPIKWPPVLNRLRERVAKQTGMKASFWNSVLINWYAKPEDSVEWHHDNDPWLVESDSARANPNITVPSITLGCARRFDFARKVDKNYEGVSVYLPNMSLLVMGGMSQAGFSHRVPPMGKREAAALEPTCLWRINLTFRHVIRERVARQLYKSQWPQVLDKHPTAQTPRDVYAKKAAKKKVAKKKAAKKKVAKKAAAKKKVAKKAAVAAPARPVVSVPRRPSSRPTSRASRGRSRARCSCSALVKKTKG